MSVKKDKFIEIGAYLMAALKTFDAIAAPQGIIPIGSTLPALAWFDKQMGQFTNSELAQAIPLPCILMEYQPFTWVTVGKNVQRGNGNIRFYIYFENYADAYTGSMNQDLALQFFDFTDFANLALQGFSLDHMTALQRVGDNEDSAEDMIITSQVDYGTILTDVSTEEALRFTIVDPDVVVTKLEQSTRPVRPGFKDGYTT
jgi:hypothetical protein